MITDAIKFAKTDHVVYFLLTAYVETLDYYDPIRSCLPARVKRLPLSGKTDVTERLRGVEALDGHCHDGSSAAVVIQEAVDVFSAASQRLKVLQA